MIEDVQRSAKRLCYFLDIEEQRWKIGVFTLKIWHLSQALITGRKKLMTTSCAGSPILQLSAPQVNRHNLKPWLSLFTCGAQPLGYTWTRLYYNIGMQLQSGLLFNSRRIWSLYGLGGHIHLLWHHTGNLKGFSPMVGFFTKFVPAISEIQWN